jgi:hypothetical protein
MCNPAFIVDGHTELRVIQRMCPGKSISRTDLNGKTVTISSIAKKISNLIKILNNRYYPIIILVDREQRSEDTQTLKQELHSKLVELGHSSDDIRVFFADRMFENWILADWSVLETTVSKPSVTDGLNGSSVLRTQIGNYSKTADCVELFLKCNYAVIYNNSPSFRDLVDSISDIQCRALTSSIQRNTT